MPNNHHPDQVSWAGRQDSPIPRYSFKTSAELHDTLSRYAFFFNELGFGLSALETPTGFEPVITHWCIRGIGLPLAYEVFLVSLTRLSYLWKSLYPSCTLWVGCDTTVQVCCVGGFEPHPAASRHQLYRWDLLHTPGYHPSGTYSFNRGVCPGHWLVVPVRNL